MTFAEAFEEITLKDSQKGNVGFSTLVVISETRNALDEETPVAFGGEESAGENTDVAVIHFVIARQLMILNHLGLDNKFVFVVIEKDIGKMLAEIQSCHI